MNKYEPVIGIEVHVELNTKTKMFCRCSADYFGKKPNTHTCPICLGLPGALPYINEEAIKKCIQIGLALNCSVNEQSYFERKNYFYPDLAKGYQISQLVKPLNINGKLKIDNGKWIRINRTHQEEDTGKLTHIGSETLIDFNRSGVPLVEIVTEPDFNDSSQVKDYAKKLQQIFRCLGVSNADMEKGDMRLEANVSVREISNNDTRHSELGSESQRSRNTFTAFSAGKFGMTDSFELPPYRVELKNINSFRFMQAAIEYEIKRQVEVLESGEKLTQETRGWNETKKETFLQRSKEEAHDYKYFPEPDLPEIQMNSDEIGILVDQIKSELPELPAEKSKRFAEQYGLNKAQIAMLVDSKEMASYFEDVVKTGKEKSVTAAQIANHIINKKKDFNRVSPEEVIGAIHGKSFGVISDEGELEKIVKEAVEENPKAAEDYMSGKEAALQVLIGAVMRKTSGKADVGKVREILQEVLRS